MKNKIDTVITLDNGSKYMILDQGNYNGKAYFLTSKLDESGENLTENFLILEETIQDGISTVNPVQDEKLLKALAEYFKNRA